MSNILYNIFYHMKQSLTQYIKNNDVTNINLGYFIGYLHLNHANINNLVKERYIFENYIIANNGLLHVYKKHDNKYMYYENYTKIFINKNAFCIHGTTLSLTDDNWTIDWYPEDHNLHHPEFKNKIFNFLCCLKRTRELTGNIKVYKVPKYILFEIIKKSIYVIL